MTLSAFIAADQNTLFTAALILMIMIALLEGITTLIGMGISEMLETVLPDLDFDLSTPDAPQSVLSKLLGWLNFGRVPLLIIFVCFLSAFGTVGYTLQYLLISTGLPLLPQLIMVPVAFIISMPFVRLFTSILQKIMPRDETSALSEESFIGATATITLGTAKKGSPAEAKVTDKHGQTHYFMVQPHSEDEEFNQGEKVLLSEQFSSGFYAIKATNPSLI